MALFRKNPNEVAYTGGKKHWTDVIKNSGSGELLIWRQPEEDFNTNSTLIVMPGEEAIFIKGGTIEKVFENGTYKLSTENYPFISRLRNAFSGGISTFNCVVYFVRKADSREILWGTSSPIQVRDKVHNIRTEAKARGAYKVRIENPGIFLEKLVGNNIPFQCQEDLDNYFANEFQGKIKSAVSKFLNEFDGELIGIDAYLDELSEKIEFYIDEIISEYGLKCAGFSLSGLDIDTTKYDTIDESQIELIARQKEYMGDKAGTVILGDDWGRIQGVKILNDAANNPSAGGGAAIGANLGVGIGTATVFSTIAQKVFTPVQNEFAPQQPVNPTQAVPSGRFTQKGAEAKPAQKSKAERFAELKELFAMGAMSEEEFERKRREIIDEI